MNDFSYSFIQGFLYFFGLADNPAKNIKSTMLNKSDYESLSGDWYKIGNGTVIAALASLAGIFVFFRNKMKK